MQVSDNGSILKMAASNLTKNEKKVLQHLLNNARTSDSAIAEKLKISSQAVGKIRRKLENTLIDAYSLNLNFAKLGIQTFAIALARLTTKGLDAGELEMEQKLINDPNIIQLYRLPNQNVTHIILYGFKDLNELDNFFHSSRKRQEIHSYIEHKELYTFSHHSLIKSNPIMLFNKFIEDSESSIGRPGFKEFDKFKQRVKNDK